MEKWLSGTLESVKSSGGLEAICSSLISQQGFGKSGTFYKRDLKIVLSFIFFLSTCDLRAAQKRGGGGRGGGGKQAEEMDQRQWAEAGSQKTS